MQLVTVGFIGFALIGGSHVAICSGIGESTTHQTALERRGCCSHHAGVCGCEKGRALCCDGQLSPTCGCD